jgi:ribose transport system ATP-binding protein
VTTTLKQGEIHAVIGENSAGKSTLMNIICGKLAPDAGTIFWRGSAVRFSAPSDALAAGIATVPQELIVCSHLTVAENVMLGAHRMGKLGVDWRETRRVAHENLAMLDPSIDPSKRMRELSTARQQLVQIARATAADAKAMIFDEPTASLAEREVERLFAFIRSFREKGGSIFYISHRLDEILKLADRISVLRDGALICEMDPATATKDEMVRQMAERPVRAMPARPAGRHREDEAPILRVNGLTRQGEFDGVSFELRCGEILGVSGLIGSGRTELAKCLFGATKPQHGRIEIAGHTVRHRRPSDAIVDGLVYLPEERKTEGIFAFLSVAENIGAARLADFGGAFHINWKKLFAAARDYEKRLDIRTPSIRAPISSLSGGNQQKAVLARWLLTNCKILVLDEPTRGIDVNAKAEIQGILRGLTESGLAIIYISSELQELIEISDRILVMHDGQVKGCVAASEATQEDLLRIAMS